jgi:hypothetical protein
LLSLLTHKHINTDFSVQSINTVALHGRLTRCPDVLYFAESKISSYLFFHCLHVRSTFLVCPACLTLQPFVITSHTNRALSLLLPRCYGLAVIFCLSVCPTPQPSAAISCTKSSRSMVKTEHFQTSEWVTLFYFTSVKKKFVFDNRLWIHHSCWTNHIRTTNTPSRHVYIDLYKHIIYNLLHILFNNKNRFGQLSQVGVLGTMMVRLVLRTYLLHTKHT